MPAINLSPPLLTDKDEKIYTKNPFAKRRWIANPGACEICRKRDGHMYNYHDVPKRPHPNCKCRVEAVEAEQTIQQYVPPDRIPWPNYSVNIRGTAIMMTVGEGGDACFLRCNVSTACIPEKRVADNFIKGRQYNGVYKATLFGPAISATLLGGTTSQIELYPTCTSCDYKTPLHAMEGWANVLVGGWAFAGNGHSASIFTLGATKSTSWKGHQDGVEVSIGWYGGWGYIESYTSFECGYS
ncbi:hypothetical protein [Oceanidesulfovibrio marinus]|uniref:Uncharacterized protein n=1 Tax=Oceanidesulfovibrio marinus TaxID=370038 RepID=A0ABX6NIJ7_9BACT|nr:hypothetical protein [Oceanidesulfovibrio marinus]QJT10393.1 hypothetical protein E8L03_16285 [Oceanidesulfovibrio marinus]